MMTAEKWYQYQDSYQKYGLDMKPSHARQEKPKQQVQKATFSAADKMRMLSFAVLAGIMCIILIISAAWAAAIKCDVNNLIAENAVIQGEIDNLNVKLERANSITSIEDVALNQLGMVYPTMDNVIYLNSEEEISQDFASLLKSRAYN